MYEKAPSTIEVVFPMKDGVISRFHRHAVSSAEPVKRTGSL